MRQQATRVISVILALVGVVLTVEAAFLGGNAGFVVGPLFVLAGLGRLYLTYR